MPKFYSELDLNNLPIKNPALYSTDEINALFSDVSETTLEKYQGLIVDSIVSSYFVHSSAQTKEDIDKALSDANAFASDLFAKVSTMSTSYVTSLPTEGNSSIIYVLEKTLADGSVVHLINLWNSETSSYVETGSLESALNDVVTNDSLAKKLEDYALKTEVIKTDDLVTTIDSTSTNAQVPTAKSVYDYVESSNVTDDHIKEVVSEDLDKKVDKTTIGTTDISSIGDGTVTGAINAIENDLHSNYKKIVDGVYMQCSGKHRVLTVNTAYSNIKKIMLDTNDRPIITTSNAVIRWANNGSYVTLGYLQVNNDGTIVAQKYDVYNGTTGATDFSDSDGIYGSISYITK